MLFANLGKAMEEFFQLNTLLSRALEFHIASRNGIQKVGKEGFGIVGSSRHQKMVEAVDHAATVKVVG